MKTISRYIMTLALLLTAVTGAWAGEEPQLLTTITFDANGPVYSESGIVTLSSTGSGISSAGIYYILPSNPAETMVATVDVATGKDVSKVVFYGYDGNDFVYPLEDTEAPYVCYANAGGGVRSLSSDLSNSVGSHRIGKIEVYGPAEAPITVEWDASTKTGTFSMPGSDVVLTPQYAPTAKWAVVDNVEQLPAALEGVIADTDAPLIAEGTVAFAGQSTTDKQGTVMYAVTPATETEAPALDAANKWSADVPTAKLVADGGADVLVWYYIKGADTPDGQQATEENTFNDSEISATPLTVQVLTNKFDIQFTAANANTIEAGKATVTVGGTAATVTEGKLQGVKMGSEVKIKANTGYKFRKVEVKKKEAGKPLANATAEDLGKVVCAAGHLHDAKTAVPDGCTAVGILAKVTETGHGLILALKDATSQYWNTINGWTSASYAGTTLKVLPDDAARGTNLTSYTTLGETTVSNWAVAQIEDFDAIFKNLGSTRSDNGSMLYDDNVNNYITTGVGGTALSDEYWSATEHKDNGLSYDNESWSAQKKSNTKKIRPVLGF